MKAVESSTVVAFRALVMLACLVVAPLAAIFGSTFPDVVRAWLINPLLAHNDTPAPGADGGGWPVPGANSPPAVSYSQANKPAERPAESPASFWQPPAMAASQSALPAVPGGPVADATASAAAYTASARPVGPSAAAPSPFNSSMPRVATSPAVGSDASRGATQAAFAAPVDTTMQPGAGVGPLGHAQARPGMGVAYAPVAATGSVYGAPSNASPPNTASAAPPAGESEQFAWFEKKLREHGAAYYLLETWGSDGELYRFQCKMAVAGNPNYTRHFEATDRDKLQAMAKVLEQVEAWRSGRLP